MTARPDCHGTSGADQQVFSFLNLDGRLVALIEREKTAMRTQIIAAAFCTSILFHGAHADALPPGPGGELVEAICTGCHGTRQIERSVGYTRDDWATLADAMIDLSGDPGTRDVIVNYLATNFPPGNARPAVEVPGPLKLHFEEWVVPTLGQRARDPVEDLDGMIWWVGQWGDILGRLDPGSGEMVEFELPVGAKPHSVEVGPDGGIWYTGNKNATIGRLDPELGEIAEFSMPELEARDPHTHVFDADGILWFSLQSSNMVGRLDPATGEVRLAKAPTPNSRPYGVKIAADGIVWVACNGSNCLLKIDPATMEIMEITLPEAGTTVRRLDIAPDGKIWWVNSALGRLGRYDPSTGNVDEWPSPSGPKSHPYAIAFFRGAVWYNESGVRPDMLVRFDPASEAFQSWAIPSGEIHAGILRHMRVSRDGSALLIHQTATNRIARVTVE